MPIVILKSVGEGGANVITDVSAVQRGLNQAGVGTVKLAETGQCDAATIERIRAFQKGVMGEAKPSGLVKPRDATVKRLNQAVAVALARQVAGDRLSGDAWWRANEGKYPNSEAVGDLAPGFRESVERFIAALTKAGAVVRPSATRRNRIRAHLMHYCFRLAKGDVAARTIPAIEGCDIVWDHGDEKESRKAAQEMVDRFGIVYQPSLKSLHIRGEAIDMSVKWAGTIKVANAKGREIEVGAPQNGAGNTVLHKIGASYGVHKLLSDKPHWSINGH